LGRAEPALVRELQGQLAELDRCLENGVGNELLTQAIDVQSSSAILLQHAWYVVRLKAKEEAATATEASAPALAGSS
jgi:hypothetical protein